MLSHQIKARALCTTLASALESAQLENHGLHEGVTIPAPWRGAPHGESDPYEVQISCGPVITMELHYLNMR